MGGNSWEAGSIWYKALGKLQQLSQFEDAGKVMIAIADELFGGTSKEHNAVLKGWTTAGVYK